VLTAVLLQCCNFYRIEQFRDKELAVNETGKMRKRIEELDLSEVPRLPVAEALGLMAIGIGFSLGFGAGIGAAIFQPRAVPPVDHGEELANLRAERVRHAERASQLDHDMRTPIGTVATALEWMSSTLDDPGSQTEARQVIGRQVSRMIALTEELHELAQQLGS